MTRSPDSAPHAVTQQCSPTTPVSDAHRLKLLGKEHEFAMQCRRRSCKYFCTDQSSSSALVLFAVERKWNSSCLSVQAKLQNQGLLITEPQRFPRAYTHKKRWPPHPQVQADPQVTELMCRNHHLLPGSVLLYHTIMEDADHLQPCVWIEQPCNATNLASGLKIPASAQKPAFLLRLNSTMSRWCNNSGIGATSNSLTRYDSISRSYKTQQH